MTPDTPTEYLQAMYLAMTRIRHFEERVAELLEQKEINCPTHLYIGQEAIAAGVCSALRRDDYVFGNHRSHGHYLAKGGDMNAMMAELFGKQTGCSNGRGGSMHLIAPEVGFFGTVPIVSGTIPLAVGTALASTLRSEDRVSVTFFGDGALEEGTAQESMNLAAHRKLPVIFVCENNFYSSHLSLLERRAQDNIPQTAEAHGMPGARLDGNDAIEVHQAAVEAVNRARTGQGPSLLECRTYRWRGHVGPDWDTDGGVKRKDELGHWMKRDPIARLKEHLTQQRVASKELENISRDARAEVEESISFARQSPYPHEDELTRHVFKENGDERTPP
jgi:pyruvate dehydrogenase E1 component alpha subunit